MAARSKANGTGDHSPRLVAVTEATPAALAQLADDAAPDVDNLLAELGETAAAVQLWRVSDRGGRPAYLERMNADAFSLDYVRELHGAGTYQARVVGGGNRIVKQATFTVGGRVVLDSVPPAGMAHDARLDRVERALEALAVGIANRPAPADAGAPLEMALRIVEAMRPAMQPAPAPAGATHTEMFAMMRDMLDLRERIAETTEPRNGPDLGGVLRDGVSPLLALFDRKLSLDEQAMKRRALPTGPSAAAVALGTPGPAAPAEGGDPATQLAARIPAMARVYLRGCARADKDPELYANVVLDALPDDVNDALPALLDSDGFGARLVEAVPEWREYPGWFAQLLDHMRAALDAEASEDDRDSSTGGDES